MDGLTCSALLDLLCCDGKDQKYLNHDLYDHVRHPCGRRHLDIGLEALEEVFNALKDVNEYVLASGSGLSRLKESVATKSNVAEPKMTLTERRTPIPVKITAAGGYT